MSQSQVDPHFNIETEGKNCIWWIVIKKSGTLTNTDPKLIICRKGSLKWAPCTFYVLLVLTLFFIKYFILIITSDIDRIHSVARMPLSASPRLFIWLSH